MNAGIAGEAPMRNRDRHPCRVPAPPMGRATFLSRQESSQRNAPRSAGCGSRTVPAPFLRSGVPHTASPYAGCGSSPSLASPPAGLTLLSPVLGTLYGWGKNRAVSREFLTPVDDAESTVAQGKPAQQDGARERPVPATGAGTRREPGPEHTSIEGRHLKSGDPAPDFRCVRHPRDGFLWPLSLSAQRKWPGPSGGAGTSTGKWSSLEYDSRNGGSLDHLN